MFRWFDWVWRIVVAIIGVMIIWKFWLWWRPDPPTTYLRTDLINAQQSDTFFTGFATVALVLFDTGSGELKPLSRIENQRDHADIDGYCYRLYEVSIGYPSLQAAIANSESAVGISVNGDDLFSAIDEPRLLSGNVMEARHGGSISQFECDSMNVVLGDRTNAARLARLQRVMSDNLQWGSHVRHARNIVSSFSETITEQRRAVVENRIDSIERSSRSLAPVSSVEDLEAWKVQTRSALAIRPAIPQGQTPRSLRPSTGIEDLDKILDTPVNAQTSDLQERGLGPFDALKQRIASIFSRELSDERVRLAEAGGYLGSLKLTFSTIGIFGQTEGRWFWKRDNFYIRQDLAEATYGSDFALDVSRKTIGLFGPKRLEITVPQPQLLALDRYTTVLVTRKESFRRENDKEGDDIENAMIGDLDRQLRRVEPQAIRFAEAAMTAQIYSLVESDVGEVRVRFLQSDRDTPRQLSDLVRLMGSDTESGADRDE